MNSSRTSLRSISPRGPRGRGLKGKKKSQETLSEAQGFLAFLGIEMFRDSDNFPIKCISYKATHEGGHEFCTSSITRTKLRKPIKNKENKK